MLLISVAIPCYNESKFIEGCLSSVRAFELPPDTAIEILVLDGRSKDDTLDKARALAEQDPRIRVLDNPDRIQSTAMNIAFQEARGAYVMRLDAHAMYPPDYLRLCLETSVRTGADNVGGLFIAKPRGDGYQAQAVQALTTHKFGVGDAGYRTGQPEGPADTVPYGFFKRDITQRIGFYDVRLVRGQDYEFNRRIWAAGGKIWRNPLIHVYYFNQPDLRTFYRKQMWIDAPYNAYIWYVAPYAFALRHCVTAAFSAGVIGGAVLLALLLCFAPAALAFVAVPYAIVMGLYYALATVSSVQQALRFKTALHAVVLPVCFFLYHFLHGVGVLNGLLRLVFRLAPVQKIDEPWQGAGRKRAWPGNTVPTTNNRAGT
jgi:succinoglycan biosynthesis protein ExoA